MSMDIASYLQESMTTNPYILLCMYRREHVLVRKNLKSIFIMVNGGCWVLSVG